MTNYIFVVVTHQPEAMVMLLDAKGSVIQSKAWQADKSLGVKLLETFDELLAKEHVSWENIKRMAVHEGPGHYSALRTGVVTASVLASEKKLELVALSGEEKEEWLRQAVEGKPVLALTPKY